MEKDAYQSAEADTRLKGPENVAEATRDELEEKLANTIALARDYQRHIGRGEGGRELALAITNLEQGQLWLGKVPTS